MEKSKDSVSMKNGRISICAEYTGTPEEVKRAKRIMRRTMYRLRAAGVAAFGTIVLHESSSMRNIVFNTAWAKVKEEKRK